MLFCTLIVFCPSDWCRVDFVGFTAASCFLASPLDVFKLRMLASNAKSAANTISRHAEIFRNPLPMRAAFELCLFVGCV